MAVQCGSGRVELGMLNSGPRVTPMCMPVKKGNQVKIPSKTELVRPSGQRDRISSSQRMSTILLADIQKVSFCRQSALELLLVALAEPRPPHHPGGKSGAVHPPKGGDTCRRLKFTRNNPKRELECSKLGEDPIPIRATGKQPKQLEEQTVEPKCQ